MAIQNSLNLTATGIISADGAGSFVGRSVAGTTNFIDVANADGVAGDPTLSISTEFEETGMHGWNGSLLETAAVSVTSDGATSTFNIEKSGGGDLTVVFSDGYFEWDTSPADTIALTSGTDTAPQLNFVYFLQSTKALAVSTTSFPAAEHAPLATVFCQSAASVQTDGVLKLHAWTDHVVQTNQQGHINDLNYWIRQQQATYVDGVLQTFNINAATSPDEVTIATASGTVLQLHPQTYPAFAAADDYYVVNDSVTPNIKITDLNAISADSTGASLSNKYYSLVLWGVVSENASDSKRFINLPSGSYNTSTEVGEDLSGFANYTIPAEYTGTGFLIAEWKLRNQSAGGGTFTSIDEIDLRGLLPAINAGGGVIGGTEFADNAFRVFDDLDDSKKLSFQVSGVTTATTRELTVPNADGTIMISSAGESGTATPDSNGQMTFSGGTGLTSSAASNTVTINLDSPVVESNGGTNQTTYIAGDILYASAANTLSKLPIGTDGQMLTLSSGLPVWAGSGSGGGNFVFISSATISSDATIDFTGLSSTYSAYFFVLDAVTPATDGTLFYIRVSTDNGATFESGASDYSWRSIERTSGTGGFGDTADSQMRVTGQAVGSGTNEDLTGYVYCFNPSNTKFTTFLSDCYFLRSDGVQTFNMMGGQYSSTTAVDAVQFLFASGNLESGTISMYGIEAS